MIAAAAAAVAAAAAAAEGAAADAVAVAMAAAAAAEAIKYSIDALSRLLSNMGTSASVSSEIGMREYFIPSSGRPALPF